ncbi:hypothetical protein BMF94_6980 [Rhodotorula taiwanensis]|uniref:Very long-chain fatty acid transport protein n=1 Tax=Rhodotorula taiwanensis TaxID=741276 RepID=A0A2S5AZR3_9BASI|nr:hypothetical protein BMF94_6980 [Rhodotorula taiwanensis]
MAATALGAASVLGYLDARLRLSSDLRVVFGATKAKVKLDRAQKQDKNSLWYLFEDAAKQRKGADCLVCEGRTLSWDEVYNRAHQLANWMLEQGLQRGETIAIFLQNKPAYPILWLACLAIDVIPAFINYNLTDKGLTHCISVAKPRLVVFDADLAAPIADIASDLANAHSDLRFVRWVDEFYSGSPGEKSISLPDEVSAKEVVLTEAELSRCSASRVPDERRNGITWHSTCMLIYTSGTTGLPKAAIVLHSRCRGAAQFWTTVNRFGPDTRIYTPMPLYHSTASVLAICTAWNSQSTVIIGRKFSASTFWRDVKASDATVVQYVGEVLRYLLAVPPSPEDKKHRVRLAYGNGCRPDVWEKFRDRFGVPVISEFFASSEGNGSLINYNGNTYGAGAVGTHGALLRLLMKDKMVILRTDPVTEEPARGKDGLCIRAENNEPGELVTQIVVETGYENFAGYHDNPSATAKKVLRDVVKKGDVYFRTGDLLRRDADGLWYFADRLGDTFRWKSENVATTDVAEALGQVVGEANVYGVLVPGYDGRAGCAAIPKSAGTVDFATLSAHVDKTLPRYAQPLFVRLVESLEQTGTLKQTKVALRNEGVDPAQVSDPVYWLDPSSRQYKPFGVAEWEALKAGKIKL